MAVSDRELEFRNRDEQCFWDQPRFRPWLLRSLKMQIWANEPWRAKRRPLLEFERVNGSNCKVWWFRETWDTGAGKCAVFDMPFLTQQYFQTYLFLSAEACVSDFVRNYNGTYPKGLCSMRDRKPDTTEIDDWTDLLRLLVLPTIEYSTVQKEILDAIELLRHKAIHREIIEIDALWYSMKFPGLLDYWDRAFEVQQVFRYVLGDPYMELDTRKAADQLLFGPQMPPATLLQAHTWLQHSLEELCFRFTQCVNPAALKSRHWE